MKRKEFTFKLLILHFLKRIKNKFKCIRHDCNRVKIGHVSFVHNMKKKKKLFSNRETIKCYSWMDISFRRFEIHSNGFTIELVHILIWHSYTLSCKSYFVVCHTSRTIKIRLKTISICGTQSYVFISDNGARNHKDKG